MIYELILTTDIFPSCHVAIRSKVYSFTLSITSGCSGSKRSDLPAGVCLRSINPLFTHCVIKRNYKLPVGDFVTNLTFAAPLNFIIIANSFIFFVV